MPEPVRVFISYSHDSEAHRDRIRDLAGRLRSDGVDAWIDQYSPAPAEGWPRWTEAQFAQATFVIVACTKPYAERFNRPPGVGSGIGWETVLLRQELYELGSNARFIPVYFDSDDAAIPTVLRPYPRYSLPKDYEALLRHVWGQLESNAPSVGSLPVFGEAVRPTNSSSQSANRSWNVPPKFAQYLPRDELHVLKVHLIARQTPAVPNEDRRHRLGIQGMLGVGKTVLATALANDSDVHEAFPGGVFWLTLGEGNENAVAWQLKLAVALAGHVVEFNTVDEGKTVLGKLFSARAPSLLILDDARSAKDVEPFDVLTSPSRLLITTRSRDVLDALGAAIHELGDIKPGDATISTGYANARVLASLPDAPRGARVKGVEVREWVGLKFNRQVDVEAPRRSQELEQVKNNFAERGMLRSGPHLVAQMKIIAESLSRILDETLGVLANESAQLDSAEHEVFWTEAAVALKALLGAELSGQRGALQQRAEAIGLQSIASTMGSSFFGQYAVNTLERLARRAREAVLDRALRQASSALPGPTLPGQNGQKSFHSQTPNERADPSAALLEAVLHAIVDNGEYPRADPFRRRHLPQVSVLDDLLLKRYVAVTADRYVVTLDGLFRLGTTVANQEIDACRRLLPRLAEIYREYGSRKAWTTDELSGVLAINVRELARQLSYLNHSSIPFSTRLAPDPNTGLPAEFSLSEAVWGAKFPEGLSQPGVETPRHRANASTLSPVGSVAQSSGARSGVFISYSHKNKRWLERLLEHLAVLRNGGVKIWTDQEIEPGDLWHEQIQQVLGQARVAILLVTPAFFASRYIASNELPKLMRAAESDGLKVFWIPVSDSQFADTEVAKFQAAHPPDRPLDRLKPGERNSALVRIADKLKSIVGR